MAAARSSGESALRELRAAIETLQKDAAGPDCKGTKVVPQFGGFMAQTSKKS
jgi:hypothetical protein